MLAVVILGGISLGVMHLMKQTLTIQVSSNNSSSYQQFRSDLELILRKQSHCNANFRSKPLGTNIPISTSTNGIFTCQPGGGDCLNSSSAQLKIPAQNISWLQGDTRLADRLRMTNVTYTYNPHATNYERGLLDLTITIEEKKISGLITSRNLKYSIPVVSEGGLIIGCETQFDTVRSCEGGWGKCIENCSTGVAVETYGIFSAKNVYGQDCPFSNGQTRACSPIKSCNAFACPSGYQWSGLSLDCLSLNSSHDSNEMCYVAGTSTLNCVNGSASVANVSAVSAPSSTSYNCDCPPPSAPSIPPPPATTYSCGCGVYPDVNTTGCTYVNANKTINGNLYFMYFNCPNNRNGVQCYSQPPHAHYTFNCQSN